MFMDKRDFLRAMEDHYLLLQKVLNLKNEPHSDKNTKELYEKIEFLKRIKSNVCKLLDDEIELILKEIQK